MPPKLEPTKDQKDPRIKSSIEEDSSDVISKSADIPEDPLLEPSTSTGITKTKSGFMIEKPLSTKAYIVKSPVCRVTSDSIFERDVEDDQISSEVEKLQGANEPFEKILSFHLGQRPFTDDQRKNWLSKINSIRPDRSTSNLPAEYETEASKEVAHLKFSEAEILDFCNRWNVDDYWDYTESDEKTKTESHIDTSSDSEIEIVESETKSPRPPRRSPRHLGMERKPSWKEFKKGKNFGSTYFKRQVEHAGIKTVIKKIVKVIWRKKKQQYLKKKECNSIEVGKNEVQDFLFEAVGFMEKRYLAQIRAAALQIDPSDDDKFARDCESGTYDSQDEWLPNKETIRSKINKMSVSIPTSTLQEYGLLDILIATLPMTLNDTNPEDVLDYVEILKMARNRIPEHISIKSIPKEVTHEKIKPISGQTVVCTVNIEPTPDFERLERTGAEGYLKQIPSQDDEESNSISDGVKKSLQLESKDNETETSIKIEITEASGEIEFIDESSAEETGTTEKFKRNRSPVSPDTQSKKKTHEN